MAKMGRPKVELSEKDWLQLEAMCRVHCKKEEMSAILGISEDILDARIKEVHGVTFSVYFAEKSAGGKMSLRRRQYTQAMDGNTSMLIWLGKNWLGQTDAVEHSGSATFNLKYNIDDNLNSDSD